MTGPRVAKKSDAVLAFVSANPAAGMMEVCAAVWGGYSTQRAQLVRRVLAAADQPLLRAGEIGRAIASLPPAPAVPCPTCGHVGEPRWTLTERGEQWLARRKRAAS